MRHRRASWRICAAALAACGAVPGLARADDAPAERWCEVVYVDETMAQPRDRVLRAGPRPGLLYLNRCAGGETYTGGFEDARTNSSTIVEGTVTFPEFPYGDASWDAMMAEAREIFASFDILVTDVDPGEQPHNEVVVCGGPLLIDRIDIAGISPSWCRVIENSISFAFPEAMADDPRYIAQVVAHEAGHAFGLDHALYCPDLMTYLKGCGDKSFVDHDAACGEYEERECSCARFAQNSHRWLVQAFGAAEPTPPEVAITEPADGASVSQGFEVRADVVDEHGVKWVKLLVDGCEIATLAAPPYAFSAPADLGQGRHAVEVRAADSLGAVGSASVAVTLGEPCTVPGDCGADEACVDGRCVAAPGTPGGLGQSCAEPGECASGLCVDDGSGQGVCTEVCDPALDACPDGFTCVAAESLTGLCWPSPSSGGCVVGASRPLSRPGWMWLAVAGAILLATWRGRCGGASRRRSRATGAGGDSR